MNCKKFYAASGQEPAVEWPMETGYKFTKNLSLSKNLQQWFLFLKFLNGEVQVSWLLNVFGV